MRRIIGAFTGALAAALIVPNVASAETVVHELNTPVDIMVFNNCTGEFVAVKGTLDQMVAMTMTSSGGIHNKIHIASKGTGVGTITGKKYVFSEVFDIELNAAGAVTLTQTLNHLITSAGATDDAFLKIRFHMVFNGTHPPIILVDTFEMGCRR